jgi:orotate phosphoribosyltransferase-like protein
MIISDFTKPELDLLRDNCNFVGLEIEIFDLRSRGVPLESIAESLNLSVDGAKRISQKVNTKIARVLSHF